MTVLLLIFFCVLGAILASFVGVLAERLYTGERWAESRSRCNSCNRILSAIDLVPVLSWLVARGRCRTCGVRIPWLYTLAEATLALVFALSYMRFGLALVLPLFLVAATLLLFIVLYDLRHTIVPFVPSMLFIALALLFAIGTAPDAHALGINLLVAGVIGFGFFLIFILSRGRAMGLGDAPVALALALLAGKAALPGLLFSFWIGAVIGICILVGTPKGHRIGIEVPFVPFLALGFLLALFTQWNPLDLMLW